MGIRVVLRMCRRTHRLIIYTQKRKRKPPIPHNTIVEKRWVGQKRLQKQEDLASEGLAIITYLEEVQKATPYTTEWFYQPGMGWIWTSKEIFPYFFLAATEGKAGSWLYFSQLEGQQGPSFYDYNSETWVTPSVSDEELQSDRENMEDRGV